MALKLRSAKHGRVQQAVVGNTQTLDSTESESAQQRGRNILLKKGHIQDTPTFGDCVLEY